MEAIKNDSFSKEIKKTKEQEIQEIKEIIEIFKKAGFMFLNISNTNNEINTKIFSLEKNFSIGKNSKNLKYINDNGKKSILQVSGKNAMQNIFEMIKKLEEIKTFYLGEKVYIYNSETKILEPQSSSIKNKIKEDIFKVLK